MSSKVLLAGTVGLLLGFGASAPARRSAPQQEARPAAVRSSARPAPAPQRVDFDTQVRPVLEKRCQPCHFTGGKMYERLPFDRPQTIQALGEKLFTRIRDEQEQALLRSFLAQEPQPPRAQ